MKHKLTFLFTVLMLLQLCSNAQHVEEQPLLSDTVITALPADEYEESIYEDSTTSTFAKDVTGDTGVYFRSLVIPQDSVTFWKNKKQYKWIKNLDSLLYDEQEKAKNSKNKVTYRDAGPKGKVDLGFFSVILWILAAGFVIFILLKLFMSGGAFKSGGKKVKTIEETDDEYVENINEKDYQALKRKAYAAGDMRLATRYMFLFTLQQLQQREFISFAPDKTNSMYLNELPQIKRSGFAQLSLYYEYIWYGNAHPSQQQFDAIELKFNEFLNKG